MITKSESWKRPYFKYERPPTVRNSSIFKDQGDEHKQ